MLESVLADLRYALRTLRRAPAFAATAIVVLALGIGANTALWSAVKRMLLDPIAVHHPEELVRLRWTGEYRAGHNMSDYGTSAPTSAGERVQATFSYPVFVEMRERNRTLEGMFASAPTRVNVVVGGAAEIADALLVSSGYYDVLGIAPQLGRPLLVEDDSRTASPVAMISHAYWIRRFAGDPAILGRVLSINGVATTVVGVLPGHYRGVQRPDEDAADVHLALEAWAQRLGGGVERYGAGWWWLQIMGRMRPGVTLEQVHGDLAGPFRAAIDVGIEAYVSTLAPEALAHLRREEPGTPPRLLADSGVRGLYDPNPQAERQAAILGVVVVLVLLVVCTNVANLLLSRAATRSREIALRRSVGASRLRMIQQLVTEGVVLSALGGSLGVAVAFAARELVPFAQKAPFDASVLAFVVVLSLGTGVAFSLAPALRATGGDTAGALKESSRSLARSRSLLSSGLLVLQVAVSVVLLVGAGLFLRTLSNLRAVDVGFEPENLLLFRLEPGLAGYEGERLTAVYDRVVERVGALPGVQSVSLSNVAFLTNSVWTSSFQVGEQGHRAHMNVVSPEFFATMGIPLLVGRAFDGRDRADAPQVAIVNETAAREFFPDRDAVGARAGADGEIEVVGVVRDVKYRDLRAPAPPTVYRPHAQGGEGGRMFEVRTAVAPTSLVPAVREAVREVDPDLPLAQITTQERAIADRMAQERLLATAYSLFGGLAMILAAIGLFGLASFGVAQRTQEIGIRMALGARSSQVAAMVMQESLVLVSVGVVLGVAAALAAGRLIESLLFELAPTHPLTFAQAVAVLGAAAALAAWLPARRASRVDPLEALRCE